MQTMCICSCEMAAGGIGFPCRRHRVESRFVCMMQECERVLQEMLVALCLCVFLGGVRLGCVSGWSKNQADLIYKAYQNVRMQKDIMYNRGIANKTACLQGEYLCEQKDGVAGEEPKETLVKGVCSQQESTDKYSLGCLELFIFPAADCVSVSVDSEEKSRYENRVNTCQQHHALVNERMFVSSQSSIFVQHASVAKYVRVGST